MVQNEKNDLDQESIAYLDNFDRTMEYLMHEDRPPPARTIAEAMYGPFVSHHNCPLPCPVADPPPIGFAEARKMLDVVRLPPRGWSLPLPASWLGYEDESRDGRTIDSLELLLALRELRDKYIFAEPSFRSYYSAASKKDADHLVKKLKATCIALERRQMFYKDGPLSRVYREFHDASNKWKEQFESDANRIAFARKIDNSQSGSVLERFVRGQMAHTFEVIFDVRPSGSEGGPFARFGYWFLDRMGCRHEMSTITNALHERAGRRK